jgi:hypothetical protein
MRATNQFVVKRAMTRKIHPDSAPVDEFDAEPRTVRDVPLTLRQLVEQAVRR